MGNATLIHLVTTYIISLSVLFLPVTLMIQLNLAALFYTVKLFLGIILVTLSLCTYLAAA